MKKASILSSTLGHDPWPPVEVGISFVREGESITYSLNIKNIADYDISGLILRGSVPAGTEYRQSWSKQEGQEPGRLDRNEVSWYGLSVKAGEEKGPYCYRLEFDGASNITARAWVERYGPRIAFAKSAVWHPRIIMSSGHFHLGHRLPAILAQHKGWFREEGLEDYEIMFSGDDAHTLAGMEKGEIDIAIDPKPDKTLQAFSKGLKIYIIGAMRNSDPYLFIGAKGIKKIEELKGKAIGVREFDGVGFIQMKKLLSQAGIDTEKDIHLVKTGPSAPRIQKPYFENGTIQACVCRHYDAAPFLDEGYTVLADLREVYPDGYQSRLIAATERMVTQYPITLKAVLKGISRAYRFMMQAKNHYELLELIDKIGETGGGRDEPDDFPPDLEPGYFADILRSTHPLDGMFNIRGLQLEVDYEKGLGKLDASFNLNDIVRPEFAEEAAKELGMR